MRMGKGFKVAALVGVLSPLYAGIAAAAAPAFGTGYSYNATSNEITVTCPTGFTCSTIASDSGFLQQSITADGSSTSYIQTVIKDNNGGTFSDETFVQMALNQGSTTTTDCTTNPDLCGIVGQQTIDQSNIGNSNTSFKSTTNIASGWGVANVGDPTITISQSLQDLGSTGIGDDFTANFAYESNGGVSANFNPNFKMEIDQLAGLAGPGDSNTDNNVQAFTLREVSGSYLTGGATATLPAATTGGAVQSLSYVAGDDVKAIWVGQETVASAGQMGSLFGYQSYENVGKAVSPNPISYFSLFESGPWNAWDTTNLGAAPCITGPSGVDSSGTSC